MPPGVPDQAPKPASGPVVRSPEQDPWSRLEGLPTPRPRSRRPLGAGNLEPGAGRWWKLAAGLVAFALFGMCGGLVPDLVPDVGGDPIPAPVAGPTEPDAEPQPYRVLRSSRAPSLPDGWFRYTTSDGSFRIDGPGRPSQALTRNGGRYTFDPGVGVELTAEVRSVRRAGRDLPRRVLELETSRFLDGAGAVERARTWTGFGPRLVLVVDALRDGGFLRLRTFVADGRVFRAWATWQGEPSDDAAATIDAFLLGLAVEASG